MGNDTPKLTDDQVLEYASHGLDAHLSLVAAGYKCRTEDLLHILLVAASRQCTIESACAELSSGPSAETIRQYLNEQLTPERLPELEASLSEALITQASGRLWRRHQNIAMDLHGRPYYGKTSQEEGLWIRSKAKDGTSHFYRVATAYVIHNGLRVTLALRFHLPADSIVGVLEILVERVKALGIGINRLLLDKGFNGIDVQTYPNRSGAPAVIACSIRGKTGGPVLCARATKATAPLTRFATRRTKKSSRQTSSCAGFSRRTSEQDG